MKKVSDVFKSIRFAKGEPRGKEHSSTDDEEHYTVGEKEFGQQLQHAKKRAMQEAKKNEYDEGEYDQEGDMAKSDLRSIISNAKRLHDMIDDADNLPEWVQSKITKAEDYISTVANYMEAEVNEETVSEDKAGWSIKGSPKPAPKAPTPHWRFNKDGSHTDMNTGKTHHRDGRVTTEEVELEEAKNPSNAQINKVLGPTKNAQQGIAALKKAFKVDDKQAKAMMVRAMAKEINEVSNELLQRYKKKASDQASEADKSGDIQKGNKRFSGIVKATKKQFANDMKKHQTEEVENLEEKNVPTSPEKWAQAKSQAKAKFDVYPSAYANGWAAKKYKEMGGGWKSVSEESEQIDELVKQDVKQDAETMDKISFFKKHGVTKSKAKVLASEEKEDLPFTPDPPKKNPVAKAGKYGQGYSTVKHLARMAMQKQAAKMKKPIKEEEMSKKAQIVKKLAKKKDSGDTFQDQPVLSATITKNY